MHKIIVGLTGGIASGKSAAAKMFCDAGAYTIDTDVVSRQEAESDEAVAQLRQAFAQAFAGESLDRRALRKIVFENERQRQILNGILHPLIRARTALLASQADAQVVVIEAPLLFEAGFDTLTDVNITVSCPEKTRIERLTARDTITEELARKMIAAQLTDAEREARADVVIRNDGNLAQLRAQVLRVYGELVARAGG
ncbi:MAG: dephospho-CoA kinase [Clostridiales bacterium]|nr:dephospho-CoA kinase [Clostridiales bacterium]